MEGILNRLADLVLAEMRKKKCSIRCFAELCGVRPEEMRLLVNREKKDVRISVICKICENSEIRFSDIFEIECAEEFSIKNFVLTDGHQRYKLSKM